MHNGCYARKIIVTFGHNHQYKTCTMFTLPHRVLLLFLVKNVIWQDTRHVSFSTVYFMFSGICKLYLLRPWLLIHLTETPTDLKLQQQSEKMPKLIYFGFTLPVFPVSHTLHKHPLLTNFICRLLTNTSHLTQDTCTLTFLQKALLCPFFIFMHLEVPKQTLKGLLIKVAA